MQGNDSRAEQVLIPKLALRVGLAEWFRFVRLSLPALFVLGIYFLDTQFNLYGVLEAILLFIGMELISETPGLLSKVQHKTERVLATNNGFIELKLEEDHRLPLDGLVSLQSETHWWPLKRNTIKFGYPEKTQTIRTNLHYGPLFRRLSQIGHELENAQLN